MGSVRVIAEVHALQIRGSSAPVNVVLADGMLDVGRLLGLRPGAVQLVDLHRHLAQGLQVERLIRQHVIATATPHAGPWRIIPRACEGEDV